MRNALKIGELAKYTGCDIATIRYYEQAGLLPKPARSDGNFRLYGDSEVERLALIRRCRSLDMTLDEIRALLIFRDAPEKNCADVNVLLDEHIGHVANRITELKRLEKELKHLRHLCHDAQAAKHCGILRGLSKGTAGSRRRQALTGHVHRAHAPRRKAKST